MRVQLSASARLSAAAIAACLVATTAIAGLARDREEVPDASAPTIGTLTQPGMSRPVATLDLPEPTPSGDTEDREDPQPTPGGADGRISRPPPLAEDPDPVPTLASGDRTPSLFPTPVPLQYTDDELVAIAGTLTDGEVFESSGAFGAIKTFEDGDTRIEMEVYPIGDVRDEWGDNSTQHYWHIWAPGLVRGEHIDFGDGTTWSSGPSTYWNCGDDDRPYPYHANMPWHTYDEPGTYTITAKVTTTSCEGAATQPIDYGHDERTFTMSMRVTMPDGWTINPNDTARGHEGARCTRPDCGDFPAGFERPRNMT